MFKKSLYLILLSVIASVNAVAQQYPLRFSNSFGGVISNDHFQFQKNTTVGWGNSGAISHSYIDAFSSGDIKLTMIAVDQEKSIGFGLGDIPDGDYVSAEICVVFDQNMYEMYMQGTSVGTPGLFSIGDLFTIEKNSTTFEILKNGTSIGSFSHGIVSDLYVHTAINSNLGLFGNNIIINFGMPFFNPSFNQPQGHTILGSVILNIEQDEPPYTVEWAMFDYNVQYIIDTIPIDSVNDVIDTIYIDYPDDSLLRIPSGIYDVKITDAFGHVTESTILLPEDASTLLTGSILTDSLRTYFQSGHKNTDWGAAKISFGALVNVTDYFETRFSVINGSELLLAFTDSIKDPLDSIFEADFAIYFKPNGEIDIHEGNVVLANVETYDEKDIFSINTENEEINFYKNGISFHVSQPSNTNIEYGFDCLTLGEGSAIVDVTLFGADVVISPVFAIDHSSCFVENGSILFKGWDFGPGYDRLDVLAEFSWYLFDENGIETLISTDHDLIGVGPGFYKLSIRFPVYVVSTSNPWYYYRTYTYRLGNKVVWEKQDPGLLWENGVKATNRDYSHPYSITGALSLNKAYPQEEIWVSADVDMTKNFGALPLNYRFRNNVEYGITGSPNLNRIIPNHNLKAFPYYAHNLNASTKVLGINSSCRFDAKTTNPFVPNYYHRSTVFSGGKTEISRSIDVVWSEYDFVSFYGVRTLYPSLMFHSASFSGSKILNYYTDEINRLYIQLYEPDSYLDNLVTSMTCEVVSSYNILNAELEADYRDTQYKHFFFQYPGEYNHGALDFAVYDIHLNEQINFSTNVNFKELGDNRFIVDMSDLPDGFYILKVINEKKEDYYLRINKEL